MTPHTVTLPTVLTSDDARAHRPTFARISSAAIAENFSRFRRLAPESQIMAVVKADAYGHGLLHCARLFSDLRAEYLGVGFVEEGIKLRQSGIRGRILVLGGIVGSQIDLFLEHDLDLTASSVFKLEAIEREAESSGKIARVHLKFDTGMNRIGQNFRTAETLLRAAFRSKHVKVAGIYSHLATAEEADAAFALLQMERFTHIRELAAEIGFRDVSYHLANSAGAIRFPQAQLDMIRPGLGLYGQHASPELQTQFPLVGAHQLVSEIVYVKGVRKGEGVSYNLRWTAPENVWIATVPVGYGDGYPRLLSNKAHVLIGGKRYPIVGTVCMDQFMVNLGQDQHAIGSEVVLWGRQGDEEISLWELCQAGGFIPYELPIYLTGRVPRIFV
ncbi:MAG: alanine racemase [Calditrichaeota bacterium]|nr:alanine racemase [Calditrichota bacterium]MCB9365722.1 alanine racemase [Calditrichota bacterium]